MSLANEKDIIIPGTTGLITAAKIEANLFNKNSANKEKGDELLAKQIRNIEKVHSVLEGRANGIKLEDLVDPERISNDKARLGKQEEPVSKGRAYEDWMSRE